MADETNSQEEITDTIQSAPVPALNAEWLSSLSHELRSPLAVIQGYATLLLRHEERITPEERSEFLQAITEGSDRMASVLDSLLDVASLEMGTVLFHPLPFDLFQFVQSMLMIEQQKYPASTFSLILKDEDASTISVHQRHCVVQGDRLLLQKMLIQLLDNAHKYTTTSSSITITLAFQGFDQSIGQVPPRIHAYMQEREQHVVQLSIRDEGIGLANADFERIFERFERVDMQLTSSVSGLGLGLTLCKYIIALHDGVIWVESLPGQGSTFHMLFPTA
jgi:signal transduction histidine kinase